MATAPPPPNTFYSAGDLLLTFQKVGNTNTVYADLGNAATVFRGSAADHSAPNKINFANLSATLTSAFGSGWATDTAIYAGLAGVYATSSTSSTLVNGDPPRTLYVSAPRTSVGTVGQANSVAWVVASNTLMTTGATGIQAQNNIFGDTNYASVNGGLGYGYNAQFIVSPTSISLIDDQQPITVFQGNNYQGLAFGTFDGGIQQQGITGSFGSFGPAGTVQFALDLYRILGKNTVTGQVAGPLRTGTYEGTVTVNSSGQVSFVSQGTSTTPNYDAWMAGFPSITDPNAKLATADPDHDGMSNLMEFVLNGNPSVSDGSAHTPALSSAGTTFVFAFTRRHDSVSETTQVVQYGSDLAGWTDVPVTTGGTSGSATVTVTLNGTTDAVTVSVPKSVAAGGKLFGRLKVTQ